MPRLPRERTFLPIVPIDPPALPGPLDPAFGDPRHRPNASPHAFAVFDPSVDPRTIPVERWPSLKRYNEAVAKWLALHPARKPSIVIPPIYTANPQPHQRKRNEPKYALTGQTMRLPALDNPNRVLHRIVAIIPFGTDDARIHEGDMGGWIESEYNLSHDGDGWVYDNAKVYDGAQVQGDAQVRDEAVVRDRARVYSHAVVRDRAIVEGDAVVCAWSAVKDTARVTGHARVYSHAVVDGDTVCDWNTSGRKPRKPWSRKK